MRRRRREGAMAAFGAAVMYFSVAEPSRGLRVRESFLRPGAAPVAGCDIGQARSSLRNVDWMKI